MNTPDYESIWQQSLIRVTDKFSLPPVVLRVDDAVIGTLGNFSVSTGKAKAKKTFNVSAIVAAALINGQVLEYKASFPKCKRNILYFDTEQSPYHCQLVMQRILRLAGLPIDKEPEHLKFSHLRAIADPNERREIIRYAIYNTPNVGLVVINGIRDLMLDINNSTEATKLVGDLMQWTSEQNIHIQTVLHLNKGDDNARGHIGTELNNKAETVLQITKDNTLPERSIVAPAIIRSKPFDKFAFRLKEMEDEVCVPEIDSTYPNNECKPHRSSYHELSDTEHRKALERVFSTSEVLPYGELIAALKKAYAEVVGQAYGQTKLKELLLFLLNKGLLIKEERGKYRLNQENPL
ncbi:mobilization protein [Bacteroides heparinolyticus]|uniref:mobilization protein n=1 Tax=Prevotella heparinolytica TaxID=28113 RepID=UPI00359F2831